MSISLAVGGVPQHPASSRPAGSRSRTASTPGRASPSPSPTGRRRGPSSRWSPARTARSTRRSLRCSACAPGSSPPGCAGAAILVHMANPPAFYGRRIYYGPDGKNLNRVYPGKADGTVCDRIAHAITREVIDRHAPRRHALRRRQRVAAPLQVLDRRRRPGVDAESRELALAFGLDHILVDRGRPRDPPPAPSPRTPPSPAASRRSRPSRAGSAGRMSPPSPPTRPARAHYLLTWASWTGRRRE